jgi:hypothetical protein
MSQSSRLPSTNLTLENLKRFEETSSSSSSLVRRQHYCSNINSTSTSVYSLDEDSESLFSAPSAASSASSAPDDEPAPFQVAGPTGEQITVYSSLEQAAWYSTMRAEAERRRQQQESSVPAAAYSAEAVDDDDDDAYFSMG